jgi:DNA-directed RNA polymerase specialized sigma24 family protein
MPERTPQGPKFFPQTQWSLVGRAAGVHAVDGSQRQALVDLLNHYMPALHSYLVYRKRFDANQADDLLQGFLLSKVLEQDLISQAQRERGKFRNFLLTALNRYVISEIRRERAQKRSAGASGGGVALDETIDVPDESTSDTFDVEWARQLLSQAIAAMHEECTSTGRLDVWAIFEARVLGPAMHGRELIEYDQLVEKFKLVSPAQASNLLVTGRRTFIRVLRGLIAEYESDEEQIDAELNDLQKILASSPSPDTLDSENS